MMTCRIIVAFLLWVACAIASAQAQPLAGHVLDPQGAPVARATVQLVDAAGNSLAEAMTDGSGGFALPAVGAGPAVIRAVFEGFVPVTVPAAEAVTLQFRQITADRQSVA